MTNNALNNVLNPQPTGSKISEPKRRETPLLKVARLQDDPITSKKANLMLYELDLERGDINSPNFDPKIAAEIRRAKADSVLYCNELGDLCITTAYAFPKMYNSLPMTDALRSNYMPIRGLWLGLGQIGRFEAVKQKLRLSENKIDVLDESISNILVEDLVKMAASYYFDTDITDIAKLKVAERIGKPFEPRFYRSKFEKSFSESSFTYNLVTSLAQLFDNQEAAMPIIPENIGVGYYYTSYDEAKKDEVRPPRWENVEVIRKEEIESCKQFILEGKYKIFGKKNIEITHVRPDEITELKKEIEKLTSKLNKKESK